MENNKFQKLNKEELSEVKGGELLCSGRNFSAYVNGVKIDGVSEYFDTVTESTISFYNGNVIDIRK